MMEIKELSIDNIERIQTLFRDIFMNEPWNDDWSNPTQLHEYILDLIGNRNSLSFGLFEEDVLIGLSLGSIMHWCSGTEYYIFEFCVRQDMQGKGLGTFFLKEVEAYVKKKDVTHIFLQTERTVPAYAFYQKNGFMELTEHASLVREF